MKLVEGEIQLMINVTSSKLNTPNNLLACDFYWKPLGEASKAPVNIACKPASEPSPN